MQQHENKNVYRLAVPFKQRMTEANRIITLLEKKKCTIFNMHVGARSVVITVTDAPPIKGTFIKVVGGPAGLYSIYRKQFGLVFVEWREPYFHQTRRMH